MLLRRGVLAAKQVVLGYEDGGIPKVTGNKMVVTQAGLWLLPFWREAGGHCSVGSPLHGTPGVLVSQDQVCNGAPERSPCPHPPPVC